jgi:phospholipid transport system substrate-binding protein
MSPRISLVIALGACLMPWLAQGEEPTATSQVAAVNEKALAAPGPTDAERVVESLHAVLIDGMKRTDTLGFEGRSELIAANLDETFDIAMMARTSIGKDAWVALSDEQKKQWLALTLRYSAANYADKFDGYGDQVFKTLGEDKSGRGTLMVRTEFIQPKDKDVKFDYRLRKSKTGWRIFDVQLDGRISELALRRADYRSVISHATDVTQGFDTLVASLNEKIAGFEKDQKAD